jgi:hypothetical protein
MNKIIKMYSAYTDYREYCKNVYSDSFFFLQGIYNRHILRYTERYVDKIWWAGVLKNHFWNTIYKLYCENKWCNKFLYL